MVCAMCISEFTWFYAVSFIPGDGFIPRDGGAQTWRSHITVQGQCGPCQAEALLLSRQKCKNLRSDAFDHGANMRFYVHKHNTFVYSPLYSFYHVQRARTYNTTENLLITNGSMHIYWRKGMRKKVFDTIPVFYCNQTPY